MGKGIDILFVYPPTGWTKKAMWIAENDAPPLGLLYVAAASRAAGFLVSVLDMNHPRMSAHGLAAFVEEHRPPIVAFSVLTPASVTVKELAAMLKTRFPGTHLVAGGIHASALPADLITAGLDCAVVGEGEATMVELAAALLSHGNVSAVAGLVFRESWPKPSPADHGSLGSNRLVSTTRRHAEDDLDSLHRPARDLVPILDYGQAGAICTSRGCPYSCSFCSSVLSGSHRYRLRSIDSVVGEISELHDVFQISRFQFIDDNFLAAPDRADALVRQLYGRGYVWSCQATIMELRDRPHLLRQMYQAGCREVYFGLESGSRRILREYKSIELDSAIKVLTHAASLRGAQNGTGREDALQTVVGFMVGHPDDDAESIEETIDTALSLRRLGIDTMVSIMQPYPGSLIHRDPGRYGLVVENGRFEEYLYPKANMSTRRLSSDQISTLYAKGLLRILETY